MVILAGLGENNLNQKTGQSVASNFFVSCTKDAKNSPLCNLNRFSLLKTETMLFDAMVQTAGLYQVKMIWRASENRTKRDQFLKLRTKLQFLNDFLGALHFTIFIWKECTTPQFLITECGNIMLWYHCQCPSVSENIVLLHPYCRSLRIIFTKVCFFIATVIVIYA